MDESPEQFPRLKKVVLHACYYAATYDPEKDTAWLKRKHFRECNKRITKIRSAVESIRQFNVECPEIGKIAAADALSSKLIELRCILESPSKPLEDTFDQVIETYSSELLKANNEKELRSPFDRCSTANMLFSRERPHQEQPSQFATTGLMFELDVIFGRWSADCQNGDIEKALHASVGDWADLSDGVTKPEKGGRDYDVIAAFVKAALPNSPMNNPSEDSVRSRLKDLYKASPVVYLVQWPHCRNLQP